MTPSDLMPIIQAAFYDPPRFRALDPDTLAGAGEIIADIRRSGWEGVRRWATNLGERTINDPLVLNREELRRAWERISDREREVLQAVCGRIQRFATAQRRSMNDVELDVPGGRAGHRWVPIQRVGCYIPGGRYPLPSTALMTVATARAAGCPVVLAASPHP
ncbi:MAG TPA: histidinol dehydrogenase, partial [Pirellulaceae bacterium]|nr:histidinol dehydrogenase [Pirellulaceae bacterium]